MKKIITLLFCIIGVYNSFSQESSDYETDALIDELFQNNKSLEEVLASFSKYQLVYVSTNFNSNSYFSGRDIGVNQFNSTPKISYLHYSGFSLNVSGVYYNKFSPKWDLTTANLTYGNSFKKYSTIRYNAGYTRYFFNNGIANSFENDLSIGGSIKNKKRTLGTQFSASYLWGNDTAFQFVSSSFILFKIKQTPKYHLDFRPQFTLIAGDQTVELARISIQNGRLVTTYTNEKVFDVINKQINLPIQYSRNSFDFELGYNINFPHAIGAETTLKNTSFFNFSIAYLFDL